MAEPQQDDQQDAAAHDEAVDGEQLEAVAPQIGDREPEGGEAATVAAAIPARKAATAPAGRPVFVSSSALWRAPPPSTGTESKKA
jgi:hypothetical protein